MLIPKKNRLAIYSFLFNEGVICCKKDYALAKHAQVECPNIHVCKALQSLKSRGFVKERFSWQWYYYFLTNEGIEYLRDYLHIAADTVPKTLRKEAAPAPPLSRPEGEGAFRSQRDSGYRSEGGRGGFRGRGGAGASRGRGGGDSAGRGRGRGQ